MSGQWSAKSEQNIETMGPSLNRRFQADYHRPTNGYRPSGPPPLMQVLRRELRNVRIHVVASALFLGLQLTLLFYLIYTYRVHNVCHGCHGQHIHLSSGSGFYWFLFKCSVAMLTLELLRLLLNIYLTVQSVIIYAFNVNHSFGEKYSKNQWIKEINGQKNILNTYGGVRLEDIRGMRAPFLQVGGNKQFEMLYEMNFTYDSSMAIFENSPPYWPYTLDYQINHECMISPCPTKSFPGLWELGLVMWQDLKGGRCSMGDACSNPMDEEGIYDMIKKNFDRHYRSNRAPFGLYYHSAWFNTRHHLAGFLRFVDEVLKLPDVWFVTNWQLIQWMRDPQPIETAHRFQPWMCPSSDGQYPNRPPVCLNPTVCNVSFKKGSRFFKTCQPCPDDYPWLGNTNNNKFSKANPH